MVDRSPTRLKQARKIGAIPIDFTEGDPAQQIKERRKQNAAHGSMHPEGKLDGVECGIDAVGYQAYDRQNPEEYDPAQVLSDLISVVNPAGHLGIVGVYMPQDPKARNEQERNGLLTIPFGLMWNKGLSMQTGQASVKNYHAPLRDLIVAGKAEPSFIVSDRISIDDAPDAYAQFDQRDEVTKAIIRFE